MNSEQERQMIAEEDSCGGPKRLLVNIKRDSMGLFGWELLFLVV
jgi:hypothetical protein